MDLNVFLKEGFKVECYFEGYQVISDQPQSKGGSGEYPSPYDYFLASIGLCAGYYVQAYCQARKIDTTGIKINQTNNKKTENSYQQLIEISVELPVHISEKDRAGIIKAIEGCTVKKTIMAMPEFVLKLV